ncbi:MAG TPA: hypothetical protein EYP16_06670, partial [Candidatus Atribacteria bacterium]|nr:hypothetical protein [Candidatus Atribacteria bacterium]
MNVKIKNDSVAEINIVITTENRVLISLILRTTDRVVKMAYVTALSMNLDGVILNSPSIKPTSI